MLGGGAGRHVHREDGLPVKPSRTHPPQSTGAPAASACGESSRQSPSGLLQPAWMPQCWGCWPASSAAPLHQSHGTPAHGRQGYSSHLQGTCNMAIKARSYRTPATWPSRFEFTEHLKHGLQSQSLWNTCNMAINLRAYGTPATLPQGYILLNTCNMAIMVRVHGTPVS